ncbi:MAG: TIGR01741 family protein, partial [Staphylococcus lugdunensis]|nr:TIGR01741 family protein [Staphylococcus lugdunensis]
FFTVPQKDELYYSEHIPKDFGVSRDKYGQRVFRLCDLFDDLNAIFVKYGQEQFGTCELDFTIEGNLNVSFEYIDWKASNFSPSEKFDYYRYKKFGILPKFQYQIDDLHVVEKYVKENQGK